MKKSYVIYPILLLVIAFIVVALFNEKMRKPELTAFARGYQIALENGCFHCHGPSGIQGVSNPNSKAGDVPSWQDGTATTYIFGPDDIEHWVLDGGIPSQKPDTTALLQMPAYRDVISREEFEDLKVYLEVVMEMVPIGDTLAERGYNIAENNGCFGCHGPYGMGGGKNPGAFKKYIPGWEGKDYSELVHNKKELRNWIEYGYLDRIEHNRVARFFTKKQVIKMPGYIDILSTDEIEAIEYYIDWLRRQHLDLPQ